MSSSHYFSAEPEGELRPRRIAVRLAGLDLEVTTAGGVFSPEHLDTGTRVLLDAVPDPAPAGDLLDVGCGWGPIALSLALSSPGATVWAVDVNERALELTRRNAAELGLTNVNAVLPADVPAEVRFRTIWSNPPIRVGKAELHALLTAWLPRLAPAGDAWLVVSRNLGADSLLRWLGEELPALNSERVATDKGFRVIRVGPVPQQAERA
ncbi:MAG: methyltransferase protein [Naasia sp.]|jgi:16S rRNA (guanine1207-N2)-methyltransferase|uniref:class I SAM-dependent methyltransferase n=1 Tax=Naasia sp. TaxID=2546198 RepID=UPI002613269E|nr:methyltransferase [Naasia sp.]MCU1571275.1 methyltransferase protein [Naasia sp.]